MDAANICEDLNILNTLSIIRTIVTIILYAAPLLIIGVATFDLYNGVKTGSFRDIKQGIQVVGKRIFIGFIMFAIPTVLNMVIKAIDPDGNNYITCMNNATVEYIDKQAVAQTQANMTAFNNDMNTQNYNKAKASASKIKDKETRERYLNEIEDKYTAVTVKQDLESLEKNYTDSKYEAIKNEINQISDSTTRNALLAELEQSKKVAQIRKDIQSLSKNYKEETYNSIKNSINNISSISKQDELKKELEEVKKNSKTSLSDHFKIDQLRYDSSKYNYYLNYLVYVPDGATTKMPLLIYFHGDGEIGTLEGIKERAMMSHVRRIYGNKFPFIALEPNTRVASWVNPSAIQGTVREIVDKVIKDYAIDETKIIVSGGSRGAEGAWKFVNNNASIVSAFIPISGVTRGDTACNFKNVPTRAFSSNHSSDDWNRDNMRSMVNAIKGCGGNATFSSLSGHSHSTILGGVTTKANLEWALSQQKTR